jgi:hypothetical protein
MYGLKCAVLLMTSALTAEAQQAIRFSAGRLQKTQTGRRDDVAACLEVSTPADFGLINQSEIIASQIFQRIGVKLRWSCEQSMFAQPEHSKTFILIRLAGNSPKHLYKGALGYAQPYANSGVRVVILYDRVEMLVMNRPLSASAILGYVFAHEIGHLLSGVAVHADRGLMRAKWTSDDLNSIAIRSLSFAPRDAELIRNNVKGGFDQRAPVKSSRVALKTNSDVD